MKNQFLKTENSGQIEAVMHLREKEDQYEEEDDDVVQEIDSNDVLVDSQEFSNFLINCNTLYCQLIIFLRLFEPQIRTTNMFYPNRKILPLPSLIITLSW